MLSVFFKKAYLSSFLNHRIHQKKDRQSTLADVKRNQEMLFINDQSLKDFFGHTTELNDSHLAQLLTKLVPDEKNKYAQEYLARSFNQHILLIPLTRMISESLNSSDILVPANLLENKMEFTPGEGYLFIKETIKITGYRYRKDEKSEWDIKVGKNNEIFYEAEASYKLSFPHAKSPKVLQLKFSDSIKDKKLEKILTSSIRKELKNQWVKKIKKFLQSLFKYKKSYTAEFAHEAENFTEEINPHQPPKEKHIIDETDKEVIQMRNRSHS